MLAQVVGDTATPLAELGPGVVGSTVAVLLLLLLTLLLLRVAASYRRRRALAGVARGPLAVLAQLELSPTQSVYLVRAAGRCLLLGGTSGGLALLTELDPAQVTAASQPQAIDATSAGSLTERLRAALLGSWDSAQAKVAAPPRPEVR